jgi:hypothetical protein
MVKDALSFRLRICFQHIQRLSQRWRHIIDKWMAQWMSLNQRLAASAFHDMRLYVAKEEVIVRTALRVVCVPGWKEKRAQRLQRFHSRVQEQGQSLASTASLLGTPPVLPLVGGEPAGPTGLGATSVTALSGDDGVTNVVLGQDEVGADEEAAAWALQQGASMGADDVQQPLGFESALVASVRSFSTVHHTDNGETYFIDSRTGDSVWEDPEPERGRCDVLLASNARRKRSKAEFDEVTGDVFFIDNFMSQTSWEDPEPESVQLIGVFSDDAAADALSDASALDEEVSSPIRSPKQRNLLTLRAEAMIRAATIVEAL